MKKSLNQNKLGMIEWMLSIDFDPVEIVRVRRDMPTAYASILDENTLESKRGD